jgi:hypothetical protein
MRKCIHFHPYAVGGHALWCPQCGAIMFSTMATPVYLRSGWTSPTNHRDPNRKPKTVWFRDGVPHNASELLEKFGKVEA